MSHLYNHSFPIELTKNNKLRTKQNSALLIIHAIYSYKVHCCEKRAYESKH